MLDEFLRWVKGFQGVWFATGEEVARHVRDPDITAPRVSTGATESE